MKRKKKKTKEQIKEKQSKTIAKMKARRKDDFVFLRNVLKEKKEWAENELKRADEAIEIQKNVLEELKDKKTRLQGALIAINDVLMTRKENKNGE